MGLILQSDKLCNQRIVECLNAPSKSNHGLEAIDMCHHAFIISRIVLQTD